MSSVVINGDTSGAITLQAPSVAGTTTINLPATSGTATVMPTGYTLGAGNTSSFKNRIINGAMMIDQRNAGSSITPTGGQYSLDRYETAVSQSSKFTIQQNAGSVTPPAGFKNYLGVTSSSAYALNSTDFFLITQHIEGLNIADLGWGTANAKTVTLSFWVYSSLTGTFGGSLSNNGYSRTYPFSYSIPVANTWTQISITIAGDTTGTWLTTNGRGIGVGFSLGTGTTNSGTAGSWSGSAYYSATGATSVVGTNGATFYITGVQLEVGSTATSFDYRDIGRETHLCNRYFFSTQNNYGMGIFNSSSYGGYGGSGFPTVMRTTPTVTVTATNGGSVGVIAVNIGGWCGQSNGNAAFAAWYASAEL